MTNQHNTGLDRRGFLVAGAVLTAAASVKPVLGKARADAHFTATADNLAWFGTVPGEEMAILVPNAVVGGRFCVVESIAAPGAAAPPHVHRSADEYFFIQEGQMHFVCDGVEFDAVAGTSVVIPRGAPHAWVNQTDMPVRSLVTFTPGGMEEMFKALAAVFPHGIADLAAQYDTYLIR